MANPEGSPIWYELMTSDADGAQRFYADVVELEDCLLAGMEGPGRLPHPDRARRPGRGRVDDAAWRRAD